MKIDIHNEPTDVASPLPDTPFLARQYNIVSGPLVIVARDACLGVAAHYNIMFLEGTGGPALGDVWHGLKHAEMVKQFIPLRTPVTFTNRWD
jgi:hypothetical protein